MSGPVGGEGAASAYDHMSAMRRGGSPHDPFEPPERSGIVRGVLVVIVGVVVAVLLLPSATRSPLSVVATASTVTHPSTPTTRHRAKSSVTTTTAPAASTIHVLVANATTVNGVAGSVTSFLAGKGFATLTATNALTRLTASEIYYTSTGSVAEAGEVAAALGLTSGAIQPASASAPVASTAGAQVVVIAGQDLAARFAPATTTTG